MIVSDPFQPLNIPEKEAQEYIFSDLADGKLDFPSSAALKKLAPEKRAETVRAIGAYIKKYTASPAFIKQYASSREAVRPKAPVNKEEALKAELAKLKVDIAEAEKDATKATPETRDIFKASINLLKEKQAAMQDPKHPSHDMYMVSITSMNEMTPEEYKAALQTFEKENPATVKSLLKVRLNAFLDLTSDIDFNTQLVQKGDHKIFADPQLEAKSYEWKLCFRSGKETVNAARAFAQEWLKELN